MLYKGAEDGDLESRLRAVSLKALCGLSMSSEWLRRIAAALQAWEGRVGEGESKIVRNQQQVCTGSWREEGRGG